MPSCQLFSLIVTYLIVQFFPPCGRMFSLVNEIISSAVYGRGCVFWLFNAGDKTRIVLTRIVLI